MSKPLFTLMVLNISPKWTLCIWYSIPQSHIEKWMLMRRPFIFSKKASDNISRVFSKINKSNKSMQSIKYKYFSARALRVSLKQHDTSIEWRRVPVATYDEKDVTNSSRRDLQPEVGTFVNRPRSSSWVRPSWRWTSALSLTHILILALLHPSLVPGTEQADMWVSTGKFHWVKKAWVRWNQSWRVSSA